MRECEQGAGTSRNPRFLFLSLNLVAHLRPGDSLLLGSEAGAGSSQRI